MHHLSSYSFQPRPQITALALSALIHKLKELGVPGAEPLRPQAFIGGNDLHATQLQLAVALKASDRERERECVCESVRVCVCASLSFFLSSHSPLPHSLSHLTHP